MTGEPLGYDYLVAINRTVPLLSILNSLDHAKIVKLNSSFFQTPSEFSKLLWKGNLSVDHNLKKEIEPTSEDAYAIVNLLDILLFKLALYLKGRFFKPR